MNEKKGGKEVEEGAATKSGKWLGEELGTLGVVADHSEQDPRDCDSVFAAAHTQPTDLASLFVSWVLLDVLYLNLRLMEASIHDSGCLFMVAALPLCEITSWHVTRRCRA